MKLDVTKIKGFDTLSEEARKALSDLEIDVPNPDFTGYVTKETFDKKASEAAELSKQLKAKMSQSELAEIERNKEFESMRAELNTLKKEKTIADYKSQYLGLGYDDKLAEETANALYAGDNAKVFANQKSFIELAKQKAISESINNNPTITKGKSVDSQIVDKTQNDTLRSYMGLPIE